MEAFIGVAAILIVGGAAIFGYTMYLTSGSHSERRNLNRQF
jgi:hypothetical protein